MLGFRSFECDSSAAANAFDFSQHYRFLTWHSRISGVQHGSEDWGTVVPLRWIEYGVYGDNNIIYAKP